MGHERPWCVDESAHFFRQPSMSCPV
jgi:hypothetical protein